jgi:hypothetical protein
MTKSVVIAVPHHGDRAGVLARIRGNVPMIKARAAPFVSSIEERWEGDELTFAVAALGQQVAGRVAVDAEVVRIEVDLPWMMAAIAGQVRRRVGAEAAKLLAKP